MKKISAFIGSPRKKGNSAYLANELIVELISKFETEVIHLYSYAIEPCIDCRACKKGDYTCVLNDQMVDLYEKIDNSDILVFATPIYWFGPTAQTKLLIDRFRPYFVNKKLNGKKAALLLSAGSGAGDCDLTIQMFNRIFNALEIEFVGAVTSESYNIGDAEKDLQVKKHLKILTKKIMCLSDL